jgi:hypothetical protein
VPDPEPCPDLCPVVLIKVKVYPCLDLNFAGSRQKNRPQINTIIIRLATLVDNFRLANGFVRYELKFVKSHPPENEESRSLQVDCLHDRVEGEHGRLTEGIRMRHKKQRDFDVFTIHAVNTVVMRKKGKKEEWPFCCVP